MAVIIVKKEIIVIMKIFIMVACRKRLHNARGHLLISIKPFVSCIRAS